MHNSCACSLHEATIIPASPFSQPQVLQLAVASLCTSLLTVSFTGTNVWMLSADGYPDYDQFEIYGSEAGTAQRLPDGPVLTADWAQTLARRAIFRGYFAADACVRRRYQAAASYVDGWQDTLRILGVNRTFSG